MEEQKSSGTAYLLWALGLCGVCGVQRFYLGHTMAGLLYLFTFGFCWIGQLIDLILIPGIVGSHNRKLQPQYPNQNIVMSTTTSSDPMQTAQDSGDAKRKNTNRRKVDLELEILHACKDGPMSLAHITLEIGEESERIKNCLDSMTEKELIRQDINSSGVVVYQIC